MEIIKINPTNPDPTQVQKIVDVLNKKGVVLFPTETVYTLAGDATNQEVVAKVYEIKGRDFSKPLHVVVDSLETAKAYTEVSSAAVNLASKFLPGPLTIVLHKNPGVLPDMLTSGLPTLGIRIPNLPICLEVSKLFKKPFTTTSANISGGLNPYSVEDCLNQFNQEKRDMISLIVDAGPLPNILPSTIVDLTVNPWTIIREGPIKKEDIETVLVSN